MKLRITDRASKDLKEIADHTLARFGPSQREAYLKTFQNRLDDLLAEPEIGRPRSFLGEGIRAARCKAHMIYYRQDADDLVILRIRHGAQDEGALRFFS